MPVAPQPTNRKPCFGAKLCAELKRLTTLVVFLALLALAGKYYCFDRLNEELRRRVELQLREHYQGLKVTVRSARRIAGQGVEIRGVRIGEAGGSSAPMLAHIDEIFAHCDTRLPEFLTKPPQISLIDIRGLQLRAERKPSGRWNLAHLLPLPSCQSSTASPAPTATISSASLEIIDPTSQHGAGLMLRDIQLAVTPEALPPSNSLVLRLRGTLAGDHVERVELAATLDPTTSRWELRGSVEGLEFSPRMRAALPSELAASLASLSSIRGRTYFGFNASRAAYDAKSSSQPPVQFVVHGKISEGRIDDSRLPDPLTEVEAALRFDNHGLSIGNLTARCGASQIELSAPLIGLRPTDPIELNLRIHQMPLESLPQSVLPTAARELWQRFSPRGRVNVSGKLQCLNQQWQPDLKIECHDLSLSYSQFRYRLTDGTGNIAITPNQFSARLRLVGGGQFIRCDAEVTNPGPHFVGWTQIRSEGPLAIDEKLLAALDAPAQKIVRGFRPRGGAGIVARFHRQQPNLPLRSHIEINLQDCAIQHDRFQYPIDRVNGQLLLADGKWRFQNLTGSNDSADITGNGIWSPHDPPGGQLKMQFLARDVPLSAELRQSLPPSAQALWSSLQPRGNIDQLQVDLGYSGASKHWSLDFLAHKAPAQSPGEGRSISLEPAWFRYALNGVTGSLHYHDGLMELTRLRASHGQAAVSADGRCSMSSAGGCRLELHQLAADRLEVDQELLSALPAELGQALARVPLQGPLSILGKLTITVPPQAHAHPLAEWDVNLDVENGRLLTMTPVEHIHGGLHLTGRQSPEGVFARGDLQVDSATVRNVQLTNLQGPFWCDGRSLVFGALADRNPPKGAPRQITARTLGGLLSADGQLVLADPGKFELQATLANADLVEITRQFTQNQHPPTGRVFGLVEMSGDPRNKYTWRGNGKINLRDADLYELPAMITLLKLLSVQPPNSTAFTNSNIDFRVEGDELALDRIDFSGDAISLKGKGRLNGQRQLDLKFYPLVGREEQQLSFLRPFLGQTGQELMLVEVTGSLDQPEVRRRPFPRLDAQLAQLFPELAREEPVAAKAPVFPAAREAFNRLRNVQTR